MKMNSYPKYYRLISGGAVYKIAFPNEYHCVRLNHTIGSFMDLGYEFMRGECASAIIDLIEVDLSYEPCDFNVFNSAVVALERKMKEVCDANNRK